MQGFFGRPLPEDFGLQHAGEYLANNFGASYKYIWGLGLLAAGQASTMSGTYTGMSKLFHAMLVADEGERNQVLVQCLYSNHACLTTADVMITHVIIKAVYVALLDLQQHT